MSSLLALLTIVGVALVVVVEPAEKRMSEVEIRRYNALVQKIEEIQADLNAQRERVRRLLNSIDPRDEEAVCPHNDLLDELKGTVWAPTEGELPPSVADLKHDMLKSLRTVDICLEDARYFAPLVHHNNRIARVGALPDEEDEETSFIESLDCAEYFLDHAVKEARVLEQFAKPWHQHQHNAAVVAPPPHPPFDLEDYDHSRTLLDSTPRVMTRSMTRRSGAATTASLPFMFW